MAQSGYSANRMIPGTAFYTFGQADDIRMGLGRAGTAPIPTIIQMPGGKTMRFAWLDTDSPPTFRRLPALP